MEPVDSSYEYPLIIQDQHLFLIKDEDYFLIDTGAQISFGNADSFNLLGKEWNIKAFRHMLDLNKLQKDSQTEFKILLGMDIIAKYDILLDIPGQKITFYPLGSKTIQGKVIPFNLKFGLAMVFDAQIQDQIFKLMFDTGAFVGYLNDPIRETFDDVGEIEDFSPFCEKWVTKLYLVSLKLQGQEYNFSFGKLPDILLSSLKMVGADGVLSLDFIENAQVYFLFSQNQVVFV